MFTATGKSMKKAFIVFALTAVVVPLRIWAQEEPATKAEMEEVKAALEAANESAAEYRGYVDALRKIKLSGYVQPQFRSTVVDNVPYTIGTFNGGVFPQFSKNLFQVRRGRVKVTYDNVLTQFVLQIDATQSGFATKDAYLSLTEPWLQSFGLTFGIFDRPFGYEIGYSSSSRESPERARFTQTLFPGERELGLKLFYAPQRGPLTWLRLDLGLFNGSGPTAVEFDNFKDLIGRVGAQIPFEEANAALDLGVSTYMGNVRNPNKTLGESTTLSNGLPGWRIDSTASNLGDGVSRQYFGIDAQFYFDLPVLGGMILRGEYVFGKQPGTTSLTVSPVLPPTSTVYHREFTGWYVYYVQNIGAKNQFVAKYDVYDPNTKVNGADFRPGNTGGATGLGLADIKFSTLGLGWLYHWDDTIKLVLYHEWVMNEKLENVAGSTSPLAIYRDDVRDNVLTFRIQYRFP